MLHRKTIADSHTMWVSEAIPHFCLSVLTDCSRIDQPEIEQLLAILWTSRSAYYLRSS